MTAPCLSPAASRVWHALIEAHAGAAPGTGAAAIGTVLDAYGGCRNAAVREAALDALGWHGTPLQQSTLDALLARQALPLPTIDLLLRWQPGEGPWRHALLRARLAAGAHAVDPSVDIRTVKRLTAANDPALAAALDTVLTGDWEAWEVLTRLVIPMARRRGTGSMVAHALCHSLTVQHLAHPSDPAHPSPSMTWLATLPAPVARWVRTTWHAYLAHPDATTTWSTATRTPLAEWLVPPAGQHRRPPRPARP